MASQETHSSVGDERIVIMGAWKPEGMSHHPNLGGPGFATSSSPSALHHATRACPLSVCSRVSYLHQHLMVYLT